MFILYVDESGDPRNVKDEYFVLGAVAVYETTAYFLSRAMDKVQNEWFPDSPGAIEFHSAEIYNHNGEPWHSLGRQKCQMVLEQLCGVITAFIDRGLFLFGVAVHKASFPNDDPVEKAFHELCGHFDKFIEESNTTLSTKERDRGLMILDSARYKGHLDKLLLEYRRAGGTKFGRVKNFADAPSFADSKTTRLLQAADLVAYSIFKRYERHDARLLDQLMAQFHQSDGVIHGLMHLVAKWRDCPCPACMSRNLSGDR